MKPSKKIMLLTSCALAIFALAACGTNQKQSKEKKETSIVQKSSSDKEAFNILYSRVPTEATTDVKVHAKKMEEYFSNFKFNENARMLSVIVHDNLDGNTLFVGHVGVLVPAKDGYLFVEKLTFEEPYQAIKFATKEDVYNYLETKYQDYTGEGLAKPFIMDNEKWVEMK